MAFTYYKSLTLSEAQSGTADSTDWPLAICLDGNVQAADTQLKDTNNSGVCRPDGFDIRPYSDAALTSPLTYQLVSYDGATGKVEMHVKIPTLSTTTDTVIYLAYGDASLSSDGSSTGTWNSNFLGVYHFKDGTTLNYADATSGGWGAFSANAGTPTAAAGNMDGGIGLTSGNNAVTAGAASVAAMSMSVWVKATARSGYQTLLSHYQNSVHAFQYQQYFSNNGKLAVYLYATGGVSFDASGATTMTDGVWYHVGWSYSTSDGLRGYINGVQEQTAAANGNLATGTSPRCTIGFNNVNGENFAGTLDEARVSNVVRPVSWFLADYNSQKASSTFITWGTQTAAPAGGHSLALLGVGR